jgi:hypothetical protein
MRIISFYDVIIDNQIVMFFVNANISIHQQILKVVAIGAWLNGVAYCLNLRSSINSRDSLSWRIFSTSCLRPFIGVA